MCYLKSKKKAKKQKGINKEKKTENVIIQNLNTKRN